MKLAWRCIAGCCGSSRSMIDDDFWISEKDSENVDPESFIAPIRPISTSGGTAKFYVLQYREGKSPKGRTSEYWIAKDLAHAVDELDFYETVQRLRKREIAQWPILSYMLDYGGTAEFLCDIGKGRTQNRKQLVLRNMRDGAKKLRFVDIKLGSVTGVGGWHGKSHINAMKNRMKDQTTNSYLEGYRAEGFDNAPESLESILATDMLYNSIPGRTSGRRIALQRLRGSDVMMYLFYLPAEEIRHDVYSGIEVSCFCLQQCIVELMGLISAASATAVPQRWIGSSVGLCFDSVARPSRMEADPKLSRVNVFDWGRSELTTVDMFRSLPISEQRARASSWEQWVEAAVRLSFEAVRFYRRQFCPAGKWHTVRFKVWSHARNNDLSASPTSGTVIGYASIPLQQTKKDLSLEADGLVFGRAIMKTVGQTANVMKQVVGMSSPKGSNRPTLKIQIDGPDDFPPGSCLKHRWRVKVLSASGLPKTDVVGWCSPVVDVMLVDEDGVEAVQRTSILRNTSTPEWDEVLEFASTTHHHRSATALLPKHLVCRASSSDVGNWDIAVQSNASEQEVKSAVKCFRNEFFYYDASSARLQEGISSLGVAETAPATSAEVEVQTDVSLTRIPPSDSEVKSRDPSGVSEEVRTPRRIAGSMVSTPISESSTSFPAYYSSPSRRGTMGRGRGRMVTSPIYEPVRDDRFSEEGSQPYSPNGAGRSLNLPSSPHSNSTYLLLPSPVAHTTNWGSAAYST